MDIVVTFLALLELIKRYRITASQADLFGEIEFERTSEWGDDEDLELEFE
jgi:chromatin segregation and condensation protein Rec8/ScpA/Scc1 (kleisin family)